jgi:transcriptional regulator with XRE-family HTH domain
MGDILAAQRRQSALTRRALSEASGVSVNTIMMVEQGRVASPGVFLVARLATALGLTLDGLVEQTQAASANREASRQIVTIGYEGYTIETLIAELQRQDVGCVADVRLTPISRKPGLSKTRLSESLSLTAISYVHYRQLGNPKDNRSLFAGDELTVGRVRFRGLLRAAAAQGALTELARRAKIDRVALLCFEADSRRCHRSVVAEELSHFG